MADGTEARGTDHTSHWLHARDACRRVALGLDSPTLLIRGARVLSLFTGELLVEDIALCGELIAGIGSYQPQGAPVLEGRGMAVLPGLIDAHVHVESSLLSPRHFAAALAPHGVTTVMAEPHELTNVLGAAALEYFLAAREGLPVDLRLMLPSSVPASPFEWGAVSLGREHLAAFLSRDGVQGLGEVMDYPGVLGGGEIWSILALASDRVKDGHAPGLTGKQLSAYLQGGMVSDHETSTPDALVERRRLGMWLLAREGTAARDFDRILPFLLDHGLARTALCTDDRHAATLVEEHHIDGLIGRLTAAGLPLAAAVAAASLAPADLYRLHERGAIAPGMRADLLLVEDPDLPHPRLVIQAGRITVKEGKAVLPLPPDPPLPAHPVLARVDEMALVPPLPNEERKVRAIGLVPDALTTNEEVARARLEGTRLVASDGEDLAILALLERHMGSGRVGIGLVRGLGLREGALASSVAHDSHHLIIAGCDLRDMTAAARAVAEAGGGLSVSSAGNVEVLPLPLAGLMTDRPADEVAEQLRGLELRAATLGCRLAAPFMALSFLSLSVIPKLRITVQGLLDVSAGRHVPIVLD